MKFEFDNNIPIYVQLVEQLKIYIISGKLKPGERLPSVRDLALETKVNPNTMQKAFVELETLKLIYTESTNGRYVSTDEKLISRIKNEHAKSVVNKYFRDMECLGFNKQEAINYLNIMEDDK